MENQDPSPVQEKYAKARSDIAKWFEEAQAFWFTRRAILKGEPLWEYEGSKLTAAKYYGPWKFNATQTAIAGGAAATSTKILNLVLPGAETPAQKPFASDPAFSKLFDTTFGWIDPFVIPVFLTAFVFLMGWGSIKSEQSTAEYRARSRAAYLYLDGAYGFWPQLSLAFLAASASTQLGVRFAALLSSPIILALLWGLFLIVIFWQFYITGSKIPKLLFKAHHYSARARRFWQPRKPDDPPWGKLVFANVLAAWPLQIAVSVTAVAIAYVLAKFIMWLRHLIG